MYNLKEYLESRVSDQLQRELQTEPNKQMPDPHSFVNQNTDYNAKVWFAEFGNKERLLELVEQSREAIHNSLTKELQRVDNRIEDIHDKINKLDRQDEALNSPFRRELSRDMNDAQTRKHNLVDDLDKINDKAESFRDAVDKMDFKDLAPDRKKQIMTQHRDDFEIEKQPELEMER